MNSHLCFVLSYRAHYARLRKLLAMFPQESVLIVAAGSMMLDRFKSPVDCIWDDGYIPNEELYFDVEGSTPHTMARSLGLATIEFAGAFHRLKPDVVVIQADRFEALAAAQAAATMNICVVHIQGGELSGSIDESYRHAITKLAHYHCPATERAKQRLLQMGEHPDSILTVGCPSSDMAREITPRPNGSLVVVHHPTTTDWEHAADEMRAILAAVEMLHMPTLLFWPNIDAGADAISKAIRQWRDRVKPDYVRYVRNMEPEEYQQAIADAELCLGNSSSFIRDASFYGTPALIVGNRQDGRQMALNCKCVSLEQLPRATGWKYARSNPSTLYGDGHVSERMYQALVNLKPTHVKRFVDWRIDPCVS